MARPRKAGEKAGTGKRRVEQCDDKGQQRKNTWAGKAEHTSLQLPTVSLVSLPFEAGAHKRAAVKIVDDRGIESLKIIPTP
jgi:hypothetical protein